MNVLFVNSVEEACGVHQFGLNLIRVLQTGVSDRFTYFYFMPESDAELDEAIDVSAADVVLYNFYPCTMPWLSLRTLNMVRARGLKQVTIFHEVPVTGFDAYIYPDPTFVAESKQLTDWYPMGRPLPALTVAPYNVEAKIPVIGSSGFGFGWKGHARLVERVLEEFTQARIRLHLPFAKYGDADGTRARAIAEQCRRQLVASRREITLEIDHEFMPPDQFVEWLAGNDLNAYLYDDTDHSRGVASTIDHALAACRPIALTRTWMFRHLHECKGIFVEESSLAEIMERGTQPLLPVYEKFSDKNVRRGVEEVLEVIVGKEPRHDEGPSGFNRLLTNADRKLLAPFIDRMNRLVPEMIARKIPEANVQQAWVLEKVWQTRANQILCVGCFEDTAFAILQQSSESVTGIDPVIDFDLAGYRKEFPMKRFECVFATSVLEHVKDDEQFIRDLCDLLGKDGVAILTVDYQRSYKAGDPLPASNERFYTPADVERLSRVLYEKSCYWLDAPDLRGDPGEFFYQGHFYSFLGLVFKKL